MSGIQSLLAIGAVWLFALVTINFNTTVVHNISIEVENKVYLTAFSLADDKIEEIKQKAFDEKTIEFNAINVNDLSSIGSEEGTDRKLFDDIDDYDNDTVHIGLPYVENFLVTTRVFYADPDDPDLTYMSKSFFKRVEVTVSSKYLSIPVNLSFIFTLHSK